MFKTRNQRLETIEVEEENSAVLTFYKLVCITNNIQLIVCVAFIFTFLTWVMEEVMHVNILGDNYTMARLAELVRTLLLGSGGWYIIRMVLKWIIRKKNITGNK